MNWKPSTNYFDSAAMEPSGPLDPEAFSEIDNAAKSANPSTVTLWVDLSEAVFLGAAFIGRYNIWRDYARSRNVDLILANPPAPLREVLDVCRVRYHLGSSPDSSNRKDPEE